MGNGNTHISRKHLFGNVFAYHLPTREIVTTPRPAALDRLTIRVRLAVQHLCISDVRHIDGVRVERLADVSRKPYFLIGTSVLAGGVSDAVEEIVRRLSK